MAFRRVADLADLFVGEKLSVVVDGRRVLVVRLECGVVAYDDRCAHRGAPLGDGRLDGNVLTCPVHEWSYDLTTGSGVNPEGARLCRLALEVRGSDVLVDVAPADPRGALR